MASLCLLLLDRIVAPMPKSHNTTHRERRLTESDDTGVIGDEVPIVRRRRRSSRKESTRRDSVLSLTTLNTILALSCVFLLGALSAIVITIWRADVGRNGRFQPLPLVEHLQVLDENNYASITEHVDDECEGDNSLGKH